MFRIQSAVARSGLPKGPNIFHHWQCRRLWYPNHGTTRLISGNPPSKTDEEFSVEPKPKRGVGRPRKDSLLLKTSAQSPNALPPLSETKPKRRSAESTESLMLAEEETEAIVEDSKPKRKRRTKAEIQAEDETEAIVEDSKPRLGRRSKAEIQAEEENEAIIEDSKPKRKRRSKAEIQAEEEAEAIIEDSKPKRKRRTKAANEAQVAGIGKSASDSTSFEPTDDVKVPARKKRTTLKPRGPRGGSKLLEESLIRKHKAGNNLNHKNDSSIAALDAEGEYDQALRGESLGSVQSILPHVTEEEKAKKEAFIELDPDMMRYLIKLGQKGAKIGDRTRVNIVHEKLCDDVLDRLKPSLTKHIGCDIIDINPGVGIWSSKLHDILKPRTHILMENDVKKYSTYLQPLLEEEGSTYKLIPKLGTVWEHLENAMTPEYLPHQKKLEPNDPKFNQPNDTLLLVANLVHHPRKVFRGFPSLSMLVTYQLLSAARSHALFHKYGLVRMLLWIPDEEKIYLLPRHVHSIRKTAIEALVTCESIREIASSTEDSSRYLRDQTLAVESAVDVVKKMDDQGIVTPAHRQGDVETAARQMIAGGTHEGLTDLHRYKRTYSDRLEDLQRRFDNGELPMRLDPDPEDPSGTPKFNPEWEQLVRLSSKVRLHGKNTIAYDKLIDEYFEINRLYGELKSANPKTKSTQKAKKALDARKEAWVAEIEAMHTVTWHQFIVRFDSRRITTPYEKRDCEPLKAYSKEFYPSTKAALMDIQPKALWPSLAKNFPENYDVFEYIIGNMYASPTQSVKEAFIGLWPGAYEQLKDNCPSLTDVTKGGCFDLSLLTVRGLTMEMLHEIIEAWLKWPFKPTRFDLMKRSGSAVWDPDSVEEFDGTADF